MITGPLGQSFVELSDSEKLDLIDLRKIVNNLRGSSWLIIPEEMGQLRNLYLRLVVREPYGN